MFIFILSAPPFPFHHRHTRAVSDFVASQKTSQAVLKGYVRVKSMHSYAYMRAYNLIYRYPLLHANTPFFVQAHARGLGRRRVAENKPGRFIGRRRHSSTLGFNCGRLPTGIILIINTRGIPIVCLEFVCNDSS